MLGNRPCLLLLVASGIFAAHFPAIAHDSEVYQRYIGKRQHKHVPVEHLPYQPVHRHHNHRSPPHHAKAKVEAEVRKVVRHMEHVKNRSHDEIQKEINDVVAKRNHRRYAQVSRKGGLRGEALKQEIERVANKEARKHASSRAFDKHHKYHSQHKSGFRHALHKGTHSQRHGHAMPVQRRPYPSHHGVAFQKREDVDDNVVYVIVTDYVTETVIPKVTKTQHITSTVFVEAAIIPETEFAGEATSSAEDVAPVTLTLDHTVTVTVTDAILPEATSGPDSTSSEVIPEAEHQSGVAEQTESSAPQSNTEGSSAIPAVEEKSVELTQEAPTSATVTVTITATVLNTMTLTETLEETVTQTVYLIAEAAEEEDTVEDEEESEKQNHSTDVSPSTMTVPSRTSLESKHVEETERPVSKTTKTKIVPVTTEAQPAPTDLPARKFRQPHDTETTSDSIQDTQEVVADIEELVKDFAERPSSSIKGNWEKEAVAEVESLLNAFKTPLAAQTKPSKSLSLEQKFHQTCKFPYGSDAYWNCHHVFFGRHAVSNHQHHTRHGKHGKYGRHEMRMSRKGFGSAAKREASFRQLRHRR